MRTLIASLLALLALAPLAAQQVTVTATGKQSGLANPLLKEIGRDVDVETDKYGDPRCLPLPETAISIDAGCVVDTSRSYSTGTTPQCDASFGQGGAGYGIVVNSCLQHDGTAATNSFDSSTGTLRTTAGSVCRKKNTTQRGWYHAHHVVYEKCPTLSPWTTQYGPFNIPAGSGWQQLTTLPVPPAQDVQYTINVTPQNAVLQAGLFATNPTVSGDKGLQLWVKLEPQPTNDLTITDLEVTQGIQNLKNEMPLVAARRTIVRAYVRASTDNVNGATATLTASRGSTLLGTISAENTAAIRTNGGQRSLLDDAYWFQLPPAWRDTPGAVKFVVTIDSGNVIAETNETNNTRDVTVTFSAVSPMVVTSVPFHMHEDADPAKAPLQYYMSDPTYWPITSNLLRFHPLSHVFVEDCGTPVQYPAFHSLGHEWDMAKDVTQGVILARVAWVRSMSACGTPLDHWVGLIHPQVNTTTGSGTTMGIGFPFGRSAWVRMLATPQAFASWSSEGGETTSHELGHNIGLPHVKCTGEEGFPVWDVYPHPAPDCRLSVGDDGYFGTDVYYDLWGFSEPAIISNDPNAPFNKRAFPFMGYKDPGWPDPFDYCLLLFARGVSCNPFGMTIAAVVASDRGAASTAVRDERVHAGQRRRRRAA